MRLLVPVAAFRQMTDAVQGRSALRMRYDEGDLVCAHLNELVDPLVRCLTVGNLKRLAMTCRTLYFAILGRLLEEVRACIERQGFGEERFGSTCRNGCLAILVLDTMHCHTLVKVRCTHCLDCCYYKRDPRCGMLWDRNVSIEETRSHLGAQHSLLHRTD